MGRYAQVGLAFATSVGVWVNFALLTWFAMRAKLMSVDARLKTSVVKLALAGLALAAALLLAAAPVIAADRIARRRCGTSRRCSRWRCSAP